MNAKLVRASTVMGAKLFNQQGEHIGKVANVLIHPSTAKSPMPHWLSAVTSA